MASIRPWYIVFALILTVSPAFAVCSDNLGAHIFIEEVRANIEAQCPCDQAVSRASYVKCAKAVIAGSLANGELPVKCRKEVVRSVTRSTCGRPGYVACCMQDTCHVYSSSDICGTRGLVGNTPSCFDACGPHCGNGLIETGEQCDDRNTLSGDGCSGSCQMEVPSQCVALSAAEYIGTLQSDDFFDTMRSQAKWLGYTMTPVMPMRCDDGAGGLVYFAFFMKPSSVVPLLLMSRPGATEPFSQVLIEAVTGTIGTIRFVSGMYRVDFTDAQNPIVMLYDSGGQPIGGASSCSICLHTDCTKPSGEPCNAPNCFGGVCRPMHFVGPSGYFCKPTTSYCGECEKCVNDTECKSMSTLRDAVVAKVVMDQKQCSNGISCGECGWCLQPGWPGGCVALVQEAITYYDCMGFPEKTCLGYNIFGPDDTCGMRCGGGLCDIEALYNDAWAQIHACSEANNQPYFPPLTLDEVQWYIPQEQLSCCPGAQNSINR